MSDTRTTKNNSGDDGTVFDPLKTNYTPVGERMPDGTLYAGLSPDTGRPMYVLACDIPLGMTWKQAMEYAANLEGSAVNGANHPKGTFRLPTRNELTAMLEHRDKIGGFGENGSLATGWYWSSTLPRKQPHPRQDFGWAARYDDDRRGWYMQALPLSARLVRS